MSCHSNLITPDKGTPGRLALYANQLPGITLALLTDLTKDEQADYLEFWDEIYERAWSNFIQDVQTLLADKFHIDLKLVSRETSKFTSDTNSNTGLAGILIEFEMPKYARIHIVSFGVDSNQIYASPGVPFYVYEGQAGRLLDTITSELTEDLNTVNVDTDYEVEDELFVAFDPAVIDLKETENRYFDGCTGLDKLSCTIPFNDGQASVHQINGGGLNVKFNIHCSIEKFVCENINLFKQAFWYRIGVELMIERLLSDRFNRWTTLTTERAEELMKVYQSEYDVKIKNSVRNLKITEDTTCFICKSFVSRSTQLP
jgi:hypothetical protein